MTTTGTNVIAGATPTLDLVVSQKSGEIRRLVLTVTNPTQRHLALALPSARENTSNKLLVTFPPESYLVDDLTQTLGAVKTTDRVDKWYNHQRLLARTLTAIASQQDIATGLPYNDLLYPYQRVGARWLATAKHGILGDDPGLGKSIQALAACQMGGAKRVLIIAPNIVKRHWQDIIFDWLGSVSYVCTGNNPQRQLVIDRALLDGSCYLIINHEMLRGDNFKRVLETQWDCVIADEAHRFQGRPQRNLGNGEVSSGSQQSAGANKLKYRQLYELTGTPIWNRPESVWHLFHLLYPHRFSSYWTFVGEFCNVAQTDWGLQVNGFRADRLDRLQSLLATLLLRRRKEEVLPDLPAKVRVEVEWEMSAWQGYQYDKVLREARLQKPDGTTQVFPNELAKFPALRTLLNAPALLGFTKQPSPKDRAILDLLDTLLGEKRKVVVFTWHVGYAEHLASLFQDKHIETVLVDGTLPERERTEAVASFRQSDTAQVLVATIAAVGIGIDLVEATAAIFAEMDYVPANNLQAEDRLHRIGQTTDVTIYRVVCRDTIEDNILWVSDTRQEISDRVLALQAIYERMRILGDVPLEGDNNATR